MSRAPSLHAPGVEHCDGEFRRLAHLFESQPKDVPTESSERLALVEIRCDFDPPVSPVDRGDVSVPRCLVGWGTEAFRYLGTELRDVHRALRFGVGASAAAARRDRDGAQTGNDNGPS